VLANKKDTYPVTVFDNNNEPTPGATPPAENGNAAIQANADLFVEKLLEIKREDGTPKYESVEAALDALKASQEHIRTIEAQNAEYKTKAQEAEELKATLERLKGNIVNQEKPAGSPAPQGGLSEEAAAQLFEQKLAERDLAKTMEGNLKQVNNQLIEKFGTADVAGQKVKEKAAELGLSLEDLKALSAKTPKAVLALFGEAPKNPPSNISSSVRIPPGQSTEELKAPEKSLISGRGATTANQTDYVRRIKENVYKRYGIQT
jgi:hypothetical protein